MARSERRRRTAARTMARTALAADYGSPWKEVLDRFLEAFLAFFFPEVHADIDWSRGFEMLDKELQKIVRHGRVGYGRWGFRTSTEFAPVKLLDWAADMAALEANPNPFATVALAHLKTLDTRKAPADRQAWKVRLVKGLHARGMDPENVRHLFRFIDWIMELPEALEGLFWQEISEYEEEKHMPFIDIAERKGMEKGLAAGLLAGIEACLKLKFGEDGLQLMPEIRELKDHELLRAVLRKMNTAASPDEVRRVWSRKRSKKGRQT